MIINTIRSIYKFYNKIKFVLAFAFLKGKYSNAYKNSLSCDKSHGKISGIASFTMMKDEEDIVEHFIRINSLWCDHFFIYDDASSDATVRIINHLINEGYHITLINGGSLTYQQNFITTSIVRLIAQKFSYDYIVPLDSDELILQHENFKNELKDLNGNSIGLLQWRSLVPRSFNSTLGSDLISNSFDVLIKEAAKSFKVVIPRHFARDCFVQMGNHWAFRIFRRTRYKFFQSSIFHAPVRTYNQILTKSLIGSYKFCMKKNKSRGEGNHWTKMAEIIKSNNYQIELEEFRAMAYNYVGKSDISIHRNLEPLNYFLEYKINYSNMLTNNPVAIFDKFIYSVVDSIK